MGLRNHHCYDCTYYSPYYIKGYCRFDRQDIGLCIKTNNQACDKRGACALWQAKVKYPSRKTEMAKDKLIQMSEDLSELKQILFEAN